MPNPDNAIFLCYRRDDSNPAAYGIYERLKVAFGERGVFLDHYGFRGGEDWRVKTKPVLEQARAVVVIINKDWIAIGKTRFRDADDPVRQELELFLARDDLLVIPVTIDRTPAPGESDVEAFRQAGGDGLANLLAGLFAKTTLKVRFDRDFEPDIQQLIRRLDEVQPDIVAEAFLLDTLRHEELSRQDQRDTVLRAARRHHARVAATLFHAFQNFVGDDQRTADLLDWIDALVSAGLSKNPGWLLAMRPHCRAKPQSSARVRHASRDSQNPTPSGPIWQCRWRGMVRFAKQTGKTRARGPAFETQ